MGDFSRPEALTILAELWMEISLYSNFD